MIPTSPVAPSCARPRRGRGTLALLVAAAAASSGCGRRAPASARPPRADGERDYPALRWVPADAAYALVAARAADLATAARELLQAAELLGLTGVERELARALAADPLSPNDLARAGVSLERSAALFSDGIYPTFLLPIGDPAALTAFLDARRPGEDLSVRRHRGHELYSLRLDDEVALAWLVMDEWLLVHLGGPGEAERAWLDRVLGVPAGRGLGAAADFAAARGRAADLLPPAPPDPLVPTAGSGSAVPPSAWFADRGRAAVHPSVVGLIRLAAVRAGLARALAAADGARPPVRGRPRSRPAAADELMPPEIAACLAGFAPRGVVFLGADVGWNRADGVVGVALRPDLAARLAAAASPPPPPGYRDFRDRAAIAADLALGLAWLRRARDASGCYLVLPMRATDRLLARAGGDAMSGLHLAGSDFGLLLGQTSTGRAALHLALSDPSFAEALLDRIPQRRLLEQRRVVAGAEVRVIDLPLLPEIAYRLTPRALTIAVGDGLADAVLGDPPADGADEGVRPELELAAFAIRPGRLESLRDVIRATAGAVFDMPSRLDAAIDGLGRYDYGRVAVGLDRSDLVLGLAMRARQR